MYKIIKYKNNAFYHHYTTYTVKLETLAPSHNYLGLKRNNYAYFKVR